MEYKKIFGNILKEEDNYRLFYLSNKLSLAEIWEEEKKLYKFFLGKSTKKPLAEYVSYPYIASGWEWSVFDYSPRECIKVSAQIFKETEDAKYLKNTETAYRIMLDIFGDFVAETRIDYEKKTMFQEKLFSNLINIKENKNSLVSLFQKLRMILNEYDWMPDVNIQKIDDEQISLTNVMQDIRGKLKIMDFTCMYDSFRIHPKITAQIKQERLKRVGTFLKNREKLSFSLSVFC